MFKKIWAIIQKEPSLYIALGVFSAILGIVVFKNFPTHGMLSGWDNLHPEFNFSLNIKRAFTAVWQENQGLGHLAGHGHAANLLHSIAVWMLSFIFPIQSLRAVFTFGMLISGGLGAFFLARFISQKEKPLLKNSVALLTSVYYVLNLSTAQHFYVQLESFIIFFGVFPWVLLTLFQYLKNPHFKHLTFFALASFLFSPIGFIPPLFLVYGITLAVILTPYLLKKFSWKRLRITLAIGVVTLFVNAYWLFPSLYFTLGSSQVYLYSQNNQLSTQDFNILSQSYGGLKDVMLLKGFYFDSIDSPTDPLEKNFFIMQPWIAHFERVHNEILGIILFSVILLGFITAAVNKKISIEVTVGLGLLLLIGFTALAQQAFPFAQIVTVMKEIPVIQQAFRASFTKFSIALSLSYAVFFGLGMLFLIRSIPKRLQKGFSILIALLTTLALVMFAFPIFQGNLFYERLKVEQPSDYQEIFQFFSSQDKSGRIANFPMQWNWGWTIYNWGYSGSGFLWYGIEQPILDRAFDVWSPYNETYYHQVSAALYAKDQELFLKTLKKYDVRWILLDESVILPGFDSKTLFNEELKQMLADTAQAKIVKQTDHITVYELVHDAISTQVSSFPNVTIAESTPHYSKIDPTYEKLGNYIETSSAPQNSFPFSFVGKQRNLIDKISVENTYLKVESELIQPGRYKVLIPGLEARSIVATSVTAQVEKNSILLAFTPQLAHIANITPTPQDIIFTWRIELPQSITDSFFLVINDQTFLIENTSHTQALGFVHVTIGQETRIKVFDTAPLTYEEMVEDVQKAEVQNCWVREHEEYFVNKTNIPNGISLEAKNASACLSARLGPLSDKYNSLLVKLDYEYRLPNGGKPRVCVTREGDTTYSCYNDNNSKASQVSSITDWQFSREYAVLSDKGTYWLDIFGYTSDSPKISRTTEYRSLILSTHSLISEMTLPSGFFSILTQTSSMDLSLETASQLEYIVPIQSEQLWTPGLDENLVNNCDIRQRGAVVEVQNDSSTTLTAVNGGVACKGNTFVTAPSQGFFLYVKGQNIEGRGLKFYLHDISANRQEFEFLFPQHSSEGIFSFFKKSGKQDAYAVNIESRSFRNSVSSSIVNKVVLIPASLGNISAVMITPLSHSNEQETLTAQKAQIITKFGTYLYQTQPTVSVFTLSQSYDTGWIAFPGWKFWDQYEHIKYNGWANGWIIDSVGQETMNSSSNETDHQPVIITILYWPQLLSFLGYGLLLGTFVTLGIQLLRSKTTTVHKFTNTPENR